MPSPGDEDVEDINTNQAFALTVDAPARGAVGVAGVAGGPAELPVNRGRVGTIRGTFGPTR
jgi:hypothetical protein